MSSDVAISVRGVAKSYRIAHGPTANTLREVIMDAVRSPFGRTNYEEFWAVNDVSFDVMRGEVIGIIGRNGAGKSTLLKILSRITRPTTGEIHLHGRVGSLLEVGTGFHPELTGRENIFLNGAILGMSREEIRRQFDAIVEFSGTEKFLDTPVKRYSSGMYVRLAFAVAAHLNPEILIVDEVLAVGDAEFQKKCMGKMSDVAREGRTVLFVSHQMPAVKSLCSRVIQLKAGSVFRDGTPDEIVNSYLTDGDGDFQAEKVWSGSARPGTTLLQLNAMRVVSQDGELLGTYRTAYPTIVEVDFDLTELHSSLCVGFDLVNNDGVVVFRSNQNDRSPSDWPPLKVGRNVLRCVIPAGLLSYGKYFISPKIGLHAQAWVVNGDTEISFEMILDHSDSPFWNVTDPAKFPGAVAPCLVWEAKSEAQAMARTEGAV